MRALLLIYSTIVFSCSNRKNLSVIKDLPKKDSITTVSSTSSDSTRSYSKIFTPILSYPIINDSTDFINQLKKIGDLEICSLQTDEFFKERIYYYNKIKINGSNKNFILVEYGYGSGAEVCYPWKYQLLFSNNGKLIAILSALRFEFVNVFNNQPPFLFTLEASSSGNGGHHLFKITKDSLEDIYDGYKNYETQTYCGSIGKYVYKPYELKLNIGDFNHDGKNDLSFSGKLLLTQGLSKDGVWYDIDISKMGDTIKYSEDHPFKTYFINYIFLYNAKTGHFQKSKELTTKNPFE